MTLKLAVAGAGFFAAVAGGALVTLAQPTASVTKAVVAANVVAIHRDLVMTIRRIRNRPGSGANYCEFDELMLPEWRMSDELR